MLIPPVRKISILLAFGRFFDFRFFSLCVFFLVPSRSAAVFCGLAADGCLFWAACFAVGVFLLRTVWAVFFVVWCFVFPVFVFCTMFFPSAGEFGIYWSSCPAQEPGKQKSAFRVLFCVLCFISKCFIFNLIHIACSSYIFASCAITTCGMVLSGACWQTPPIL